MSIKRAVKQLGASLTAVFALALAVSPVHAFTTFSTNTSTASATVAGGTLAMNITIKTIGTNAVVPSIAWTGASAGSSWKVADQYIQIDSTITTSGAGIQTYTDNTAVDANPKYTGLINATSQTPAGLVNTSTTTAKLPTAWLINGTTVAAVGTSPVIAGNPLDTVNFSQWLFHEDKAQVANNQGGVLFANADPFVTAEIAGSPNPQIHFGQGPTQFGPDVSPNFMYLQADFSTSLAGVTYKTSTLRIEAFNP